MVGASSHSQYSWIIKQVSLNKDGDLQEALKIQYVRKYHIDVKILSTVTGLLHTMSHKHTTVNRNCLHCD